MRGFLRRFRRDDQGAIAVVFGLTLLPMIGMTGAAIDYSRLSIARGAALAAADAAALETVKRTGEFSVRKTYGEKLLAGNMSQATYVTSYTSAIEQVLRDGQETAVKVTITGQVQPFILGVAGISTLSFKAESQATSGRNELTDVAFVLDTTDSMGFNNRLVNLKSATTSLIDDFIARRGSETQIRVSVIPFGRYVRIPMRHRGASWLDVPNDDVSAGTRTCTQVPVRINNPATCRQVTDPAVPADPNRMCTRDGVTYSCPRAAQPARTRTVCDQMDHPTDTREQCTTTGARNNVWQGCVGSRLALNEPTDINYSMARVRGFLSNRGSCGSEMLEPTHDLQAAKTMINGLTTSGDTYIPAGLIWGWRALSVAEPIAARASTEGTPVKRYMILVTDGQNTRSQSNEPNGMLHNSSSTEAANTVTTNICNAIKADTASGIKLYTIAFEVTDPVVKSLLQTCSTTNGGQFFDAANANGLNDALKEIGSLMSSLRLTR